MVRTDVHHEIAVVEQAFLCYHEVAVSVKAVNHGEVRLRFVGQREIVCLGTHVEILAQRVAVEISAEEKAAHVGMAEELDAHEVEHFAFKQVSSAPEVYNRGYDIASIHLLCYGLHRATLVVVCILKNIDASQAFFAEIFADDGNKVIEMFLVFQFRHLTREIVE